MKRIPIIVLDNGASSVKVGITTSQKDVRIVSNAIVRSKGDKITYFGHEFDTCKDFSSLHFRLPFERGYLVDWDAQKAIWDGIFSDQVLNIDTAETSLLITEPYFNLPNIQEVYDQFIFEEYEFQSYLGSTAAALVPFGQLFSSPGLPKPECILVVDAGFSFTHIVPIMGGTVLWSAVKRIDVGGKLLTNHLKELVSFRQWNMMEETYIMNDVKEKCCYVSTQFAVDLETCRSDKTHNTIVQEYVLPDLSRNRRGYIRQPDDPPVDGEQILYMGNERFSIPEVLFCPDHIGLHQAGLGEAIVQSISLLPEDLQGMFWANIGLIGGSTKLPGFAARLMAELRPCAPADCEIKIYESKDAITEAYKSAMALAMTSTFSNLAVTRAEYLEGGSGYCRRKFGTDYERGGNEEYRRTSPPSVPVKVRTRTVSAAKRR
ncbi:actin-like protein ARP6 [Multifurca ochricompacta]|uniref:Actin-like protein ARP6 n=1 Tax=Multifurca ochricompacta TaxID=376703 RepID=A0AAD4M5C8_9AGAM|nr:actin-like protein ARP6 [Multifurca ochricompacta]